MSLVGARAPYFSTAAAPPTTSSTARSVSRASRRRRKATSSAREKRFTRRGLRLREHALERVHPHVHAIAPRTGHGRRVLVGEGPRERPLVVGEEVRQWARGGRPERRRRGSEAAIARESPGEVQEEPQRSLAVLALREPAQLRHVEIAAAPPQEHREGARQGRITAAEREGVDDELLQIGRGTTREGALGRPRPPVVRQPGSLEILHHEFSIRQVSPRCWTDDGVGRLHLDSSMPPVALRLGAYPEISRTLPPSNTACKRSLPPSASTYFRIVETSRSSRFSMADRSAVNTRAIASLRQAPIKPNL